MRGPGASRRGEACAKRKFGNEAPGSAARKRRGEEQGLRWRAGTRSKAVGAGALLGADDGQMDHGRWLGAVKRCSFKRQVPRPVPSAVEASNRFMTAHPAPAVVCGLSTEDCAKRPRRHGSIRAFDHSMFDRSMFTPMHPCRVW